MASNNTNINTNTINNSLSKENNGYELGEYFQRSNNLDKEINKLYRVGIDDYDSKIHVQHQFNLISCIPNKYSYESFIDEYPCYNTKWRRYLTGRSCRLSSILINSYLILYDFLTNTLFNHVNQYIDFITLIKYLEKIEMTEKFVLKIPKQEFNALINILRKFSNVINEFLTFYKDKNTNKSLSIRDNPQILEFLNKGLVKFSSDDINSSNYGSWEYKPCYLNRYSSKTIAEIIEIFQNINKLQNIDYDCEMKLNNQNIITKKEINDFKNNYSIFTKKIKGCTQSNTNKGGSYKQKYLKYKNKYLNLKKEFNIV